MIRYFGFMGVMINRLPSVLSTPKWDFRISGRSCPKTDGDEGEEEEEERKQGKDTGAGD